ncbi:PhzF family phenazine biosynthesis protein [Vibrio aerogenes]|uniref:PhzF family phenazine biosynthesis protein n=1 Tax=Vibrio aerogenes TaxID=92172 RepID=UPI000936FE4F|nr:PhzF family phenazine biosynthesis protein [Vibrio aerogenes]
MVVDLARSINRLHRNPFNTYTKNHYTSELIADFCKKHKVVGFHVFELYKPENMLTASCRNFAPLLGISEESATGSASGALACYLTEHLGIDRDYVFEQGRAMNCTSIITASVESENSKIISVKVGGFASHIGTMEIPV